MGFIGKVLVLLHGALAITVLAWAVGVVTNRIDWNTPPAEAGKEKSPGLYERQEAKAKEYNLAIDRAFTRWTGNLNQVLVLEGERYPRRAFYATHLEAMVTGKVNGKPIANPVQNVLNPGPNGFLAVPRDNKGNLDMVRATAFPPYEVRPGVPADSMAGYEQKMQIQVRDIDLSQKASLLAIDEREKLNREIVGTDKPTPTKGLRTLITEQKTIFDQAEAEDRYVAVFVTNWVEQFELFRKRRDAMQARVAELNTYMEAMKKKPKPD